MNKAPSDSLKIYPVGRGIWRCESGMNNYKITDIGEGRYQCSCPARVECRHVKQLKGLQDIQSAPPAPVERRQGDRRSDAPVNLTPVVEALLAKVERLESAQAQIMQLGFVQDRAMIAIGDQYDGVWFFIDGGKPIESQWLNGYIRSIEFKKREPGKRPSHHLHCVVDADRRYVIVVGHETHFAKGLLKTLSQMTPAQLARPVRINPQKTAETIFCNLHQDGVLIRARYGKDEDWKAVAIQAMENLKSANA